MSLDERALLAAITADPADDTARLVYADWLDEHDRPARAEFIRAQFETGRHHPNSTRRAELDARARALLAEHWVDWWTPVCEAVGLPVPKRQRASRLGRFAQTLRLAVPEGRPYHRAGTFVEHTRRDEWVSDPPPNAFHYARFCAGFRRGFPDALVLTMRHPGETADLLTRWSTAAPLDQLEVNSWSLEAWVDGPFLGRLRTLRVNWCPEGLLAAIVGSRSLYSLEDLSVHMEDETADWVGAELSHVVRHPRARQFRRLHLPVTDQLTTQSLAGAAGLTGLTSLSIALQNADARSFGRIGPDEPAAAGERLGVLARSPHLAGLTELTVIGHVDPAGCRALSTGPTWAGLRKLTLVAGLDADAVEAFLADATLPALEELSVGSVALTPRSLDQLVRSPLMKQLRHISFSSWLVPPISTDELRRFPDIFDPGRVETLSLALDSKTPDELRRRLGDRMRILEL